MEQEKISEEYIKGFNEGYVLAEKMPAVCAELSTALGNSDRAEGMKNGIGEFSKEREKQLMPRWAQYDSVDGLEDKSAPDEREDIEPEME